MQLQVLVSTMHQKKYSLIKKMNIQTNVIVVNQCNKNSIKEFIDSKLKIKWINSEERGLSKSRNLAIENANDEIILLSDDDVVYIDNYKDIIIEQFNKFSDADIITFQVEGIEQVFKKYYNKPRKLNYLTLMKVASVEIAIRLNSIRKHDIIFNEAFGAGAKYYMGEENIFLYDCMKKGLKIIYIPLKIANLHIGDSTWFEGYNKEYFISKGAVFACMSKFFSFLFIIQFAIRKYNLFKSEMTMLQAIIYMLEGKKQYLQNLY